MAIIFDGKALSLEKEENLREEIKILRDKGVVPRLVSILVGDDPASVLYVNLKKKAAERVGADLEIVRFQKSESVNQLIELINKLNKNNLVHGIMVQLPLPKKFSKKDRDEVINAIAKKKDVDGLRVDSPYVTPVVKTVLEILREASRYLPSNHEAKTVVIGARGFEGAKIARVLKEMGYDVAGLDKRTFDLGKKTKEGDILISVTGSPGIIGREEIKEGVVAIDVGSPKGDVKTEEVMGKASFISPVPGGVGPVTITALLENLVEAALMFANKAAS